MQKTIKYISKNETIEIKNGVTTTKKKEIIPSKPNKSIQNAKIINKFNEVKTEMTEKAKLNKEIGKLLDQWKEVMAETKTYNNMKLALTLRHLKKEDYGWSSRVYSPYGIPLEKLEILTPTIESGLQCKYLYEIPEHKQFAMCKIIYPNLVKCNEIPFKPAKVKPYELFIGVDVSGKKIILNINHTPHVLLAGQTRKGKNGSLDHILTSLIYSCSPKELELHLFQCAKNDLIKYSSCEQVKSFVLADFDKMESVLENILKEIDYRLELMKPMVESLKGDNLYDYNKLHPNKKLPYTYIVIDEFMVLMLPSKDKKIMQTKASILAMIEKIGEMGGSVGVTYIIAHQKPSKEMCPTFIKNMSLIRICFGFDDESCGRIVLGEKFGDLALKLPARRAYYSADGKMDLIYTTNLRQDDGTSRIKEFIKDSIKSKSEVDVKANEIHDENLNSEIKTNIIPFPSSNTTSNPIQQKQPEQPKIPENKGIAPLPKPKNKPVNIPLQFNNVDPQIIITEEQKKIEAIKKIPNFVPYNPNPNRVIIDKTKIDLSKTEKPRRGDNK